MAKVTEYFIMGLIGAAFLGFIFGSLPAAAIGFISSIVSFHTFCKEDVEHRKKCAQERRLLEEESTRPSRKKFRGQLSK